MTAISTIFKNTTTQRNTIMLLWLAVQLLLFWRNGIFTQLESTKYINEAHFFLENGKVSTPNFYLYFSEILLIATAIKLNTGFILIVFIQWIFNFIATLMLYNLGRQFLKNDLLAFAATIVFLFNIPYQIYNSFLYTESLFYSFTIIYSCMLLRLQKLSTASVIAILISLAILSITRPTGILFFGATAIYIFFRFMRHWKLWQKAILLLAATLFFLIILNILLQSGGELNFMLPFIKENIICGVNTTDRANIDIREGDNSLYGLMFYITHNPTHFIRFAFYKTQAFFGMLRSYYSLSHNLIIAVFFYPFYVLALLGIRKKWQSENQTVLYFLSVIFLFWLTSALTCDDWHNRFILTVFPFIFLLGMASFAPKKLSA